jgi:type I restriction enzyme S subunit
MWTSASDLASRIDAEYYRAEFVHAYQQLRAHASTVPLGRTWLEANRIYIGIAGFDVVRDPTQYTPYLRPTDIGPNGEIDYGNLPWCERHWLADHQRRGCAKPGDLILEVKGNTQKAAVINERIPGNCIVSGSAYRLALKPEYDAHFMQAYFSSETGQRLKRRLISNTTISYIDPDSFKTIPVAAFPRETQRAIGSKMRKAERLRELALWSRCEADTLMNHGFGVLGGEL